MLAVKLYAFTWAFLLAVVGILYAAGLFNSMLIVGFGFVFSTLFFAGLVALLPVWMNEHYSTK